MPNYLRSSKDPERNLINFQKRQLIANIIQPLYDSQQVEYPFPMLDPLYSLLAEFPAVPEKDLRALSIYYEPKNCDPKSVL